MNNNLSKSSKPAQPLKVEDSLRMPLTSEQTLSKLRESLESGAQGEAVIELGSALRRAKWRELSEAHEAEAKARKDNSNARGHVLNLSRAIHSGSGTDYQISLKGARLAEQQGNTSPILQEALDKYDGQRVKLPSSSVYITPSDEKSYNRTEAEKGNLYSINKFGSFLEESFMQSFRADPSSTKRISRAGGSRTESEERIRGGILLLAEQYKLDGNQSALALLQERVENDPKLHSTLKISEFRLTFDLHTNHLPIQARTLDLDVFEKSFNKLRQNNPELTNEEFLKLAVHNLRAKNYEDIDLIVLSNMADDKRNADLSKALLSATKTVFDGKIIV